MIYPSKLVPLVGMKVGDAKEKYKQLFEKFDGMLPYESDIDINKMSAYFDENEKNKLIVTATIKYPTKPTHNEI